MREQEGMVIFVDRPVVPPVEPLQCHRCREVFFEEQGPVANRWAPRSLAMCFSCLDVFPRERWERGA